MEALFGWFFFLSIVLWLGGLAIELWAVVDVATQPEWVWPAARIDRTLWLVLTIVAFVTCFLLSVYYLIAIRPKLLAVKAQGPAALGWWQASDARWYPPPRPPS